MNNENDSIQILTKKSPNVQTANSAFFPCIKGHNSRPVKATPPKFQM